MINKYLIGVALIASLIACVYIQDLKIDIEQKERRAIDAENRAKVANEEIKKLREWSESESKNRHEYLQQLEASKDEIETLERDLANNTKRLSVRATCPKLPKTNDTGRAEDPAPELTPEAERNYIRLREEMAKTEAWINLCQKTVISWGQ